MQFVIIPSTTLRRTLLSGLALGLIVLGVNSCATKGPEVPVGMALRFGTVVNPADISVRVSLNNRAVYVYEKEEPRFIASLAIGTPENPTPLGDFKVFSKQPRKRSGTYGFFVKGEEIIPGKSSQMPSGYKYVGYPMPWWVEFKAGYGFHAGAVWPSPRTHGCLRLHRTIAADFFNMVSSGTPIHIAHSLPEDATIGKNIPRPTDYDAPDSPRSVLVTDAPFESTAVLF